MLQCTALTDVPEMDVLVALTTMPGGPANPSDTGLDGYALCELAAHDHQHRGRTERAARLWAVEPPATHDLWLLWTGTGERRTYQLVELPLCPAILRDLATGCRRPHTGISGTGVLLVMFIRPRAPGHASREDADQRVQRARPGTFGRCPVADDQGVTARRGLGVPEA
ncbi:hypothetical protein ACF1BP_11080 [Streptomyces sp. NPDC014735]|uniref:hypothetical protein n=1 Tax=unclassified Streptomyces TaxID=2593676 RepID=UPI0036F51154